MPTGTVRRKTLNGAWNLRMGVLNRKFGEWNNSDSDRDIEERVQMLLDSDSDLWNYDLHAEVSNGVVHVTG